MRKWLSTIAVLVMPLSAHAIPLTYNFNWTGSNGYTMTGSFTGEDAGPVTDMYIRDSEVSELFFEGFLNNISIGSNNTAHLQNGFNFNFDVAAGAFVLGGISTTDSGQRWNVSGPVGFGFGSGDLAAALFINSGLISGSITSAPVTIRAQLANAIPEPTSFALLGAGVIAFGVARRKKRKLGE